jgi:transcriptional regulator with XRE-family HTH domain
VDTVRFGRGVRALRQRRGWRQEDLAAAAGVSRGTIHRIEQGQADKVTAAVLERVCTALAARLVVRLDWNGEQLDRLLDGDHAALIDGFLALLAADGWTWATEVTFKVYGERGSVDVLGFHPPTGSLLVVEVKTVVPEIGSMLAKLDRKARLAARIARGRGWVARHVSRLLVIREGPTPRRHVGRMRATFDTAFPTRGVAVRRWLQAPGSTISGLLFFSIARRTSGIKRVRRRRSVATHDAHPDRSQMQAGDANREAIVR